MQDRTTDRRPLARIGGVAGSAVALILVTGIVSLALELPGLRLRTWLAVLFEINTGIGSPPADPLRVANPLDVTVLALTGATIMAAWSLIPAPSRPWRLVSVALPFVGIVLLLATHLVGRSAVMGAGVVIAVAMARTPGLQPLGYLGICANALLLVGDVTTGDSPEPFVATLVGVGYLLLLAWFALVGLRLLGPPDRRSSWSERTSERG